MHIRSATPDDVEAMVAIYAPMVLERAVSFELALPSLEDFAARVAAVQEDKPWLVAEDEGEILGYAYASSFRQRAAYGFSVEVSAYVDRSRHRRGVGGALYTRLLSALREQGYCHVFAGITLPNEQSVGFHERMGFAQVGSFPRAGAKFGAWHDVGFWLLTLREGPPPASFPRPFSEVAHLVDLA